MRQLFLTASRKLEWREVPEPSLVHDTDVLVRPIAAARCDADTGALSKKNGVLRYPRVAAFAHILDPDVANCWGNSLFRGPYPFGHECIGEVIRCGLAVRNVHPGERVVVPFQIACGTCTMCLRHLTAHCSSVPRFSWYGFGSLGGNWGGVICDLIRVPFADAMLVSVPAGISPAAIASASDNLPDAWRTVGPQLAQQPGAPVLIVGGGAKSIALYAVAIAVALGSVHVDYWDHDSERLRIAQSLGGNPVDSRTSPRLKKYPITVDASASSGGLGLALRSLEPAGICTSTGIYFARHVHMPLFHMYTTGAQFQTGLANVRSAIPEVLNMVARGMLRPELVTTLEADWNDAPRVFAERTTKVVIVRR